MMPVFYLFFSCFKVEFVGEVGEDTGGLSREFWYLLFRDIQDTMFEGSDNRLVPLCDTVSLQVTNV